MILLMSTCTHKLSEREFVKPIEDLLKKNKIAFETKHYTDKTDYDSYENIIICGTALKDFSYLSSESFSWIKEFNGKILGICSGSQILASIFGEVMVDGLIIGKKNVLVTSDNEVVKGSFESYFLISKIPSTKNLVVLDENGYVFRHEKKDFFGILFHPEVLNKEIITNFCKL